MKKVCFAPAVFALAACDGAASAEFERQDVDTKQSEFREGVSVEHLYTQYLGEPYSSNWYGRLEKSDGDWRDVYVETNEKLTEKGILSFRCDGNASAPVGWISYWSDFGDESEKSIVQIRSDEWENWKSDNLVDESGDPESAVPYEVYVVTHSRYC